MAGLGTLMASDVIEGDAVLKGGGDMSLNNSGRELLTPGRTREEPGSRAASSPSSSGVSGEGEEEELDELRSGTASTAVENGEEALQESPAETGGTPQDGTSPDNEQKAPGARSSTPVSLPRPRSPSAPIGRSVYVRSTCWQLRKILSSFWSDLSFAA